MGTSKSIQEQVVTATNGASVESRDKRCYIRAKRDTRTLYFHAAEAPPFYARLSDESHPQCAVENLHNTFTKDMLGKTGEFGSYTTRANVFAREGKFFYETKIIAIAPPGREAPTQALAQLQTTDRSATNRGGLRVGFCRREHVQSEPLGSDGYGYGVQLRNGSSAYGSVRFNSLMHKLKGGEIDDLIPGDVVGLMITLPSLEVHKKVVEGTFNSADYPELKCGPAKLKPKGKTNKKGAKSTSKESGRTKENADDDRADARTNIRTTLKPLLNELGVPVDHIPVDIDIVRDRNPFLHKSTLVYFECPEYTPHPDLQRPSQNSKQKSINPETGSIYNIATDGHPNHELPHLRTLPGSKIELWVNGNYKGIVWEHLFAFLPPASFIEKSSKTNTHGEVDDGMLGYYPAMTHYTGGAFECKFDGPWWCGYQDGPENQEARPIGARYQEQIIEDFCADLVDEIYLEQAHGDTDWMKKEVLKAAAPVNVKE